MRLFKAKFKTSQHTFDVLLNFVPDMWRMRFYRVRNFMDGNKMINVMFLGIQFRIIRYKKRTPLKFKSHVNTYNRLRM